MNGFSKTICIIRLMRDRNVDVGINESIIRCNRDDMEGIYRIGQEIEVIAG